MILGISTAAYTSLHVLISLAGIGSGFVVMFGLLTGKRLDRWTAVFLTTTAMTSVTGFGFPFDHLLPAHIVGHIPGDIGVRDSGPLRFSARRRLAFDLRSRLCGHSLPQRLRLGRPGVC
jgi:hypothetical protein